MLISQREQDIPYLAMIETLIKGICTDFSREARWSFFSGKLRLHDLNARINQSGPNKATEMI